MKRIAVIVGSIRANAFSLQTAKALIAAAPKDRSFEFEVVEIAQLPLYNQDSDAASPEVYTAFRAKIAAFDAVLFVTPEHNRSFPAALKNALDVGSRPWGKNVWSGKPGAVASISIGGISGFGANHHLRQVLSFLNVPVMAQPEFYLGSVMAVFDESGAVKDQASTSFFSSFMVAYCDWVEKLTA